MLIVIHIFYILSDKEGYGLLLAAYLVRQVHENPLLATYLLLIIYRPATHNMCVCACTLPARVHVLVYMVVRVYAHVCPCVCPLSLSSMADSLSSLQLH